MAQGVAAIAFYTCLPVPHRWPLDFRRIAQYAPLVGVLIGALLACGDAVLAQVGMPVLTRSALIVAGWVALTGGLHLDGAMDMADGLAVLDPKQRLTVMADSRTGAFGTMAAVLILGIKILALAEIGQGHWFALMAAAGWGRWGQVVAIARYPYLKAEGKGAFHKAHIRPPWDLVPGGLALLLLCGLFLLSNPNLWAMGIGTMLGGVAIALFTGDWIQRQLGGHTGDTYGAVVEWTETLLLAVMTVF
ncbi:MAG TPA: adenosylcobinamide-GDP ribazoletransferase [Trichocoleus sp.]